jgi:hypothetical protein
MHVFLVLLYFATSFCSKQEEACTIFLSRACELVRVRWPRELQNTKQTRQNKNYVSLSFLRCFDTFLPKT